MNLVSVARHYGGFQNSVHHGRFSLGTFIFSWKRRDSYLVCCVKLAILMKVAIARISGALDRTPDDKHGCLASRG